MLDRTIAPEIKTIEHFTIQKPARRFLRNGIPLNVINAGTEDVVRLDIVFRSGTLLQERLLQALLTNVMLRNSTASYSQHEVNEQLDFYGAWMKSGVHPEYSFITLYSLHKYFDETCRVVASMIKEPLFIEEEFVPVREERKQQSRVLKEKVSSLAYRALAKGLYGEGHVLARFADPENYDSIGTDDLKAFHRLHYHSGNCVIYLSGKITDEQVSVVERHWGEEEWGSGLKHECPMLGAPLHSNQRRIFTEKSNALQSAVNIGMLTIPETHPDFLKLGVAVTMLGGYFGSRLMSNIREDKGYTYGINAYLMPNVKEAVFMISTQTATEYVEPLIAEVYKEMDRMCKEAPSPNELDMVRNYMLGNICRSYEDAFSLAEVWVNNDLTRLPENYIEASVDAIKSVTCEEIRELSQKYFCKECLIESVAGKKM